MTDDGDGMTRRDFLRGAAPAAMAAAVSLSAPSCRGGESNEATNIAQGGRREPKAGNSDTAKVVLVRDAGAVSDDGSLNFRVIERMLDQAVTQIVGEEDARGAWRQLVKPDDLVGIKSNVWARLRTPPQVEQILGRRIAAAGVALPVALWGHFRVVRSGGRGCARGETAASQARGPLRRGAAHHAHDAHTGCRAQVRPRRGGPGAYRAGETGLGRGYADLRAGNWRHSTVSGQELSLDSDAGAQSSVSCTCAHGPGYRWTFYSCGGCGNDETPEHPVGLHGPAAIRHARMLWQPVRRDPAPGSLGGQRRAVRARVHPEPGVHSESV